MARKVTTLLALVLMISFLFPAAASAQNPDMIRVPFSADPEHLDPFRSTTTTTRSVIIHVYEGLTTLDPATAGVVPALADSWDISETGWFTPSTSSRACCSRMCPTSPMKVGK
jgi:ABC-type oligopeptide transport system substrate-binding subunit